MEAALGVRLALLGFVVVTKLGKLERTKRRQSVQRLVRPALDISTGRVLIEVALLCKKANGILEALIGRRRTGSGPMQSQRDNQAAELDQAVRSAEERRDHEQEQPKPRQRRTVSGQ